jgi:hypothetical protein
MAGENVREVNRSSGTQAAGSPQDVDGYTKAEVNGRTIFHDAASRGICFTFEGSFYEVHGRPATAGAYEIFKLDGQAMKPVTADSPVAVKVAKEYDALATQLGATIPAFSPTGAAATTPAATSSEVIDEYNVTGAVVTTASATSSGPQVVATDPAVTAELAKSRAEVATLRTEVNALSAKLTEYLAAMKQKETDAGTAADAAKRAQTTAKDKAEAEEKLKPSAWGMLLELLELMARIFFPIVNLISAAIRVVRIIRIIIKEKSISAVPKEEWLRLGFDILGGLPAIGGAATIASKLGMLTTVGAAGNAAMNLFWSREGSSSMNVFEKGGYHQLLGGINEWSKTTGDSSIHAPKERKRNPFRETLDGFFGKKETSAAIANQTAPATTPRTEQPVKERGTLPVSGGTPAPAGAGGNSD